MATIQYSETTCDVCGVTKRFDIGDRPWRRTVWLKGPNIYDDNLCLRTHELDICDKCLWDSVALLKDGDGYRIQGRTGDSE